jgi:flagellar M-ring protein FliF
MVRAIQNLVASSVPNLKPEKVTVIDQHGKTLSAPSDDSLAGKEAQDRKAEVEQRIAKTVKDMVEGVLGPARRASTSPPTSIWIASRPRKKSSIRTARWFARKAPTRIRRRRPRTTTAAARPPRRTCPAERQQRLPAIGLQVGPNESVTNYEISKSVKTTVQEPGTVKKVAVAVAIDGVTAPAGKDGKPVAYTPRTPQEIQQIEDLVKTAVGYDATRGDQGQGHQHQVPDARGTGSGEGGPAGGLRQERHHALRRAGRAGRRGAADPAVRGSPVHQEPVGAGGGQIALAGPSGQPVTRVITLSDGTQQQVVVDQSGEPIAIAGPVPSSEIDSRIDIAKIEGQVKASSIKRVSEFVDKHPDESVAILRNWLHESN